MQRRNAVSGPMMEVLRLYATKEGKKINMSSPESIILLSSITKNWATFMQHIGNRSLIEQYGTICNSEAWADSEEYTKGDRGLNVIMNDAERNVCKLMAVALFFANGWGAGEKPDVNKANTEVFIRCAMANIYTYILEETQCAGKQGIHNAWRAMQEMGNELFGAENLIAAGTCSIGMFKEGEGGIEGIRRKIKTWLQSNAGQLGAIQGQATGNSCPEKVVTKEETKKEEVPKNTQAAVGGHGLQTHQTQPVDSGPASAKPVAKSKPAATPSLGTGNGTTSGGGGQGGSSGSGQGGKPSTGVAVGGQHQNGKMANTEETECDADRILQRTHRPIYVVPPRDDNEWNKWKQVLQEFTEYMQDHNDLNEAYGANCYNACWDYITPGAVHFVDQTVADVVRCRVMSVAWAFANGWGPKGSAQQNGVHMNEQEQNMFRCEVANIFGHLLKTMYCTSQQGYKRGVEYSRIAFKSMQSAGKDGAGVLDGPVLEDKCTACGYKDHERLAHAINLKVVEWFLEEGRIKAEIQALERAMPCKTKWTDYIKQLDQGDKHIKEGWRDWNSIKDRLSTHGRKKLETAETLMNEKVKKIIKKVQEKQDDIVRAAKAAFEEKQQRAKKEIADGKDKRKKAEDSRNGEVVTKKPEATPPKAPETPKEVSPDAKAPKEEKTADSTARADGGLPDMLPASPAPAETPQAPSSSAAGTGDTQPGTRNGSTQTTPAPAAGTTGKDSRPGPIPATTSTCGPSTYTETTEANGSTATITITTVHSSSPACAGGSTPEKEATGGTTTSGSSATTDAAPPGSSPHQPAPGLGHTGASGSNGSPGDTGPSGPPGPSGAPGSPAPLGDAGTTGPAGKDREANPADPNSVDGENSDPPPLNPPKPKPNPNPNQSGASGSGAGGAPSPAGGGSAVSGEDGQGGEHAAGGTGSGSPGGGGSSGAGGAGGGGTRGSSAGGGAALTPDIPSVLPGLRWEDVTPYTPALLPAVVGIGIIAFFLWRVSTHDNAGMPHVPDVYTSEHPNRLQYMIVLTQMYSYTQILQHLQRGDAPPPDYGYTMIRDRQPGRLPAQRRRHPRVRKRTIIELHLELLHECAATEWENVKDHYLQIVVEAFAPDLEQDEETNNNILGVSTADHGSAGNNVSSTVDPSTDIERTDACPPNDPDPWKCMETIQFAADPCAPNEDDPWSCMETIELATDTSPPNAHEPDAWSCMHTKQLEQEKSPSQPAATNATSVPDYHHWIPWIDRNKHLLRACTTQPWFLQLKADWKQYYQQHSAHEDHGHRALGAAEILPMKKLHLWKQWVSQQHALMNTYSEQEWFQPLLHTVEAETESHKREVPAVDTDVEVENVNTAQQMLQVRDAPRSQLHQQPYMKKRFTANICILILALVIEQCEVECRLQQTELYVDALLQTLCN
ncbi:hypothetical protein AK88_04601 [Plasmodium fragile]|uniref:Schizont-infected cell agglutination C-terminal domain-containing protein n=1 Tax=Plasmodium fragile TaxID=5857 RepID=A0A0D9QFG8_PLAFR|nr:uncharacterized protein AK88_04601 [Plasmodium fragile]KJP85785.1 hypothetical protein AK88_04601 [Plasmodium fragile]